MGARKLVERQQWEIFIVQGVEANSIKNRIEFRVPRAFESLDEIFFSAVDAAAPVAGSKEVEAPDSSQNIIGTLSLHTNDKTTHPLHMKVQIAPHANLKRRYNTLKLAEPLKSGALIQGYFIDAGVSSKYPYNLVIYLKGKHRFEGREACSTH